MTPRRVLHTTEESTVIRLLILVSGLALSSVAQAVCYRDGKPYPTGAEVKGYVCQEDGTWKKIQK